jgi:DNA invertase Pin-like site-specific DNA recombinase
MLIGYARVSTGDQNTKLQIDALKRAGCKRIFEEKASGARADRPELAKAMAIAREKDILVVWRLDRLGRSLPHLITTIRGLGDQGVGFRSLTENIDTTSSGGKLVFHLFGALAEFERDIIRERTKAGLAAARAQGRIGGRRRVMTAEDLKLARALIADPSWTRDAIASKIGVSHMTIYRELKRAGITKRSTRRAALPRQRPTRSPLARPQPAKRSHPMRKKC